MEAMTSEREAFEASVRQWPTFKDSMLAHDGRHPDYYGNPVVQGAWEGWKARAHLAQPAQAVDVSDLDVLRRLKDALPTVGLNGWVHGVAALDTAIRALSVQKAGPVGDGWKGRAAKLLRDLEFSALGGRRCPCCLGWNDQNGETDRQHTKTCELAALIAASPTPDKEGA